MKYKENFAFASIYVERREELKRLGWRYKYSTPL